MKKGYIISSQAVKLISCFLTLVLLFSLVLSVNSTAEASQETDTTIETEANDLDTYPDEYDELDIPEEIRKELDKHGISIEEFKRKLDDEFGTSYKESEEVPATPLSSIIKTYMSGKSGSKAGNINIMSGGGEIKSLTIDKWADSYDKYTNRWKVNLSIKGEGKEVTSDIVLVIDRSKSMADNNRLQNAKEAAKNFVEEVLSNNSNTRIALISYAGIKNNSEDVTIHNGFTNNINALKNSINRLSADGGTFTQAAIRQAKELLDSSTADKKQIVLLSDGQPTYSYAIKDNTKYNSHYPDGDVVETREEIEWIWIIIPIPIRVYYYEDHITAYENPANLNQSDIDYSRYRGTGNSLRQKVEDVHVRFLGGEGSSSNPYRNEYNRLYHNSGNAAISEASFAKSAGYTIYTIAFNAGNEGGRILEDIASSGKAYSASDENLSSMFDEVAGGISAAATDVKVTDILGEKFSLVSDIEVNAGNVTWDEDNKTIIWTLERISGADNAAPVTMSYVVEISEDAESGVKYPTNESAVINYKNVYDQEVEGVFPQPRVSILNIPIQKLIRGNLGDVSRKFKFEIRLDTDKIGQIYDDEFLLSHKDEEILKHLSDEDKIILKELDYGDYEVTVKVVGVVGNDEKEVQILKNDKDEYVINLQDKNIKNMKNKKIIVINEMDIGDIPTGVFLDSLPYIIILAVAIAGISILVIRKRRISIEE